MVYQTLSRICPTRTAPQDPRRIVFIRPCCIGDVIMATAALLALRRRYPSAHITWAVGGWSREAVSDHVLLNDILDTGPDALPVKSPAGFLRFVRQLRAGNYDMAVSLVRSPLMSAAVMLSGIPNRAGLDSDGRGFGYTLRVPVYPDQPRHEAEIYLDVVRALGGNISDCYVNVPVDAMLTIDGITSPYIVIHPGGGRNPGMVMDSKRWPPENFARLADELAESQGAQIILLGGPDDADIVQAVQSRMDHAAQVFIGTLSLAQIGTLAANALLYVGNDTGMTHLAAAASAKTVMILGPSDPKRYAPFSPDSLALWKPTTVGSGGVAEGTPVDWNWQRDGVSVDEALAQIRDFLQS